MKEFLVILMLLSCLPAVEAFAQREIGNTRDPNVGNTGTRDRNGRSGESLPAETPAPQPPPPAQIIGRPLPPEYPAPPVPTIIIEQPTCSVPFRHGTVVIVEQPQPEEAPEVFEIVLREFTDAPSRSGFDFSGDEIVSFNNEAADVYFSVSNEGPEFVVSRDEDIQDVGQVDSFFELEDASLSEWSATRRVHAEPENAYVVWTWDNQYYKFRVVSLSETRVSIEWMKMEKGARLASVRTFTIGVE